MLENLFGSKTRVKLLNLFFNNTNECFYVRGIARELKENINSIRREILNLEKIGIISQVPWDKINLTKEGIEKDKKEKRKYYQVNKFFTLYYEMRDLIIKSRLLIDEKTIEKLKSIPGIKLLVLTGVFVSDDHQRTDILVVGNANKERMKRCVSSMERIFERPLRYTIFTRREFNFRNVMTDKFLFEIMEGKKIVIVDKMAVSD
ncbi:hypothetical protein COV56_01710 [Candidatus Kuenenbacteria bacterium CG11_big_fil_rev_8_21_14_0_20_37_9]|uniref:HTH arsR-type domain-containing protein n=2 Tax=Candidatus Kueneniibacteriota TaxID=1752740 RepID=A0A2M6XTB9_9BACT|nr:MAG: hypothetical protein AUJ29_01365 [Candidatus Kuenenbacteria bacterium CG1_02_38_13]PIR05639.1 MAG: hypothetical protein COV56_01710 [Candidatus Kuenenbacteria bacterium CG11_big_fil_rev_8_21_14_0_20_37_9]PIU10877.1 MAG: hypothetical protein COT27_00780 [Candidatus Kuenenbacteria bacterium CG08_land_8_20_14_0_20_37_23]